MSLIRTHVFIDFWNYELYSKSNDKQFKTDWSKLPSSIVLAAAKRVNSKLTPAYEGANVYISYGPNDDNLREWAEKTLSLFTGITVIGKDRVHKSAPKCPSCYDLIGRCPSCSAPWYALEEKGVDIKIAVDMLDMAWRNVYDVAVLVSDDTDFIPAIETISSLGKKVVHAGFRASDLRRYSWDYIDLNLISSEFKRRERKIKPENSSPDDTDAK